MDDLLDIAGFQKHLLEARARTEQSIRRLTGVVPGTPLQNVLDDLDDAWQELAIAEKELRRQAEALASSRRALENERQRYFGLFHGAPDGYLITDMAGVVRDANDRAVELLEAHRARLVGKPLSVFVPEDQRTEFGKALARLPERSRIDDWEMEMRTRAGGALVVSVTVVAGASADGLGELRWQLRDVSEPHLLRAQLRMAYEELENRVRARTAELEQAGRAQQEMLEQEKALRARAEDADRAKDDFLATLSHELRTPLTAMVGWVHLLSQGGLPSEDRRRAFDVIARSTQAQVKLIDEILDVSRILTGKLALEPEVVDLGAIVGASVDALRPAADAKHVELVHVPFGAPLPVDGDRERLAQVMGNLLSNALKFTSSGGRVRGTACSRAFGSSRPSAEEPSPSWR